MRFGSYGALRQMPNTLWRNETSGRLRYGDEDGAVHLVTQVSPAILLVSSRSTPCAHHAGALETSPACTLLLRWG